MINVKSKCIFIFFTVKNTVVYKFSNPAGHRPMAMIPLDKLYLRYQTRHQIISKIRQVRDSAFHAPNFYLGALQFLYDVTFKITRRQRSHQSCKVIQQYEINIFQHSKHLHQPFTVLMRFKIGTVYPVFIGFIYSCQRQCFGGVGISFVGDVKFLSCCSLGCYIAILLGSALVCASPIRDFLSLSMLRGWGCSLRLRCSYLNRRKFPVPGYRPCKNFCSNT